MLAPCTSGEGVCRRCHRRRRAGVGPRPELGRRDSVPPIDAWRDSRLQQSQATAPTTASAPANCRASSHAADIASSSVWSRPVTSHQAYEEPRKDDHPVVVISARDIVEIMRRHGIATPAETEAATSATRSSRMGRIEAERVRCGGSLLAGRLQRGRVTGPSSDANGCGAARAWWSQSACSAS